MEIGQDHIAETQDFLLSVIGSAPYGIITIDSKGDITMINDLAREFLNVKEDVKAAIDTSIISYINNIAQLKRILNGCIKKKRRPFDLLEVPFHEKYLTIRGRLIKDGMIIAVQDITNIKEMEAMALNSMLQGQEMERRRLSKEIHDGMGPLLSTVRMNVDTIKAELGSTNKAIASKFESISKLINTIANDMRSISHDLMPRVLEDFGLEEAFQNLAERINESDKIKMEFYSTIGKKRFDKDIELGLYRIGQELINNVLKHAGSEVINLQLIKHPKSIVLMVEDSGKGFSEGIEQIKTKGIGLLNIETRAKALGGIFQIDSVKSTGVTASVEIPL